MSNLWVVAPAVFALNVPFGYLRASARRFSLRWFLAIHVPVPGVVALRMLSGIGWRPVTFVVLIAAYSAGQLLGGFLRGRIVSARMAR